MTEYFEKNKDGKVEFTETALKTLLDRVYNQGYNDGKNNSSIIWNSPSRWYDDWWKQPYVNWSNNSSSTGVTINDCNSANTTVTLSNSELNKESI